MAKSDSLQNLEVASWTFDGMTNLPYSSAERNSFEMPAFNGVELLEFATNKFGIDQLGPKAIAKISGKAWDELRMNFLVVCGTLLEVSPDAYGELTTTYVKFTIGSSHISRVYAAIWVKNSKSFTVGLALPDDCKHPVFTDALKGMSYKGLTKYVTITSEDTIPEPFSDWAEIAYKLRLSDLE